MAKKTPGAILADMVRKQQAGEPCEKERDQLEAASQSFFKRAGISVPVPVETCDHRQSDRGHNGSDE